MKRFTKTAVLAGSIIVATTTGVRADEQTRQLPAVNLESVTPMLHDLWGTIESTCERKYPPPVTEYKKISDMPPAALEAFKTALRNHHMCPLLSQMDFLAQLEKFVAQKRREAREGAKQVDQGQSDRQQRGGK